MARKYLKALFISNVVNVRLEINVTAITIMVIGEAMPAETDASPKTLTNISVLYFEDIADKKLVDNILEKIDTIDIDGIVDSSSIGFLLEDENNMLIQERSKTKELQECANNLEKISTQVLEENQTLIKWIEKILDTFGTMEIRNKRNIQIPVYKNKEYKAYDRNYLAVFEKERITIPEITIIKMG